MSVSRRLARPMLASIFIAGGIDTLRDPSRVAKPAERVGVPIAEKVPGLPTEPEGLVRINGGVQVGAGLLLALGKLPRLSSAALLASLVPTTLAGHRFWEADDDATAKAQRTHFLKNLGLAGGLLVSAFDTDGAPSLGWRAARRASRASAAASAGTAAGRMAAGSVVAKGVAKGRDGAAAAAPAVATGRQAAKAAKRRGRTGAATALHTADHALHSGLGVADIALQSGRAAAGEALSAAPGVASAALSGGRTQAASAAKVAAMSGRKAAKAGRRATKAGRTGAGSLAAKAGDALPVG